MKGYMKAAVLHGVNDLRVEDVLIPEIGDHDVLVKVAACGVCGSDIPRILTQGTYHFPTIPGHEFGGEVVEIGSEVEPAYLHKQAVNPVRLGILHSVRTMIFSVPEVMEALRNMSGCQRKIWSSFPSM